MTIKHQGGIFGRNPTFNDVDVASVDINSGATGGSPLTLTTTASGHNIDMTDSTSTARTRNVGGRLHITADVNNEAASSAIRFYVDNTRMVDIDSSGNIVFNTSGQGIDFSATSGTGTSELFDDYEEGTWSPVISDATSGGNTGTATVAYATYTKVGNLVHIKARLLNMNTTGMGSGNIYVQGVPFAADGDGEGVATTSYFTASANSLGITPSIDNSASHIKLKEVISGGVYTNADSSQFTSGTGDLWITITYHT
jgi:hypothetical protein